MTYVRAKIDHPQITEHGRKYWDNLTYIDRAVLTATTATFAEFVTYLNTVGMQIAHEKHTAEKKGK